MFARRPKQSSPQPPPTDDGSRTGESAPDPRDATIERLERELAEQRALAASLRESLDAASFKTEILEKSYAKQLADARDKRAAAEIELGEKHKLLAALDGGHEDTLRALTDARAELKLVTAERDQLRKQIAQGGFRQPAERAARAAPSTASVEDTSDGGGTINQLIANAGWAEKKPSAGTGHANAQISEQDAPHEDMLAPDLVFTTKDKEQDDER